MFLAPVEVDIFEYAQRLAYDLSDKILIQIDTLESSKVHFADLTLLNCNSASHLQKIEAARNYWRGTTERSFNTEVLFIGQFKIKKTL